MILNIFLIIISIFFIFIGIGVVCALFFVIKDEIKELNKSSNEVIIE